MDNLINILVAIIIIYSFLAPLIKKKKGDSNSPSSTGRSPSGNRKPSYQNRDSDIFSEIEQLMNREKIPPVKTAPKREEFDTRYSDEHLPTLSEHQVDDNTLQREPEKNINYSYRKFKISENDRLGLERDLEKKFSAQRKVYYNPTFARVRNSFLNIEDFRNGFIISEILGKPKALRR